MRSVGFSPSSLAALVMLTRNPNSLVDANGIMSPLNKDDTCIRAITTKIVYLLTTLCPS